MRYILVLLAAAMFFGCSQNTIETPKPRGYFRVDFPEKAYKTFDSLAPFSFEYPSYARVELDTDYNRQAFWYNIQYPAYKATLHLSYNAINNNLTKLLEDSRSLVYKHTVKAEAIDEQLIIDSMTRKFGIFYFIKGEAASAFQFVITDSCCHFMRGALYFNVVPNKDSLAPSLAFISEDVKHMVQTLAWKNNRSRK